MVMRNPLCRMIFRPLPRTPNTQPINAAGFLVDNYHIFMGKSLSKRSQQHALIGSFAVLVSVTVAAHARTQNELEQKDKGSAFSKTGALGSTENSKKRRLQDHPFIACIIENACVLAVCTLVPRLPFPVFKAGRLNQLKMLVQQILDGCARVEVITLLQHLLVYFLYAHIPFFSDPKKHPESEADIRKSLKDWLRTNLVVHVIGNSALLATIFSFSAKERRLLEMERTFSLFAFICKFAFTRIVNDVLFYVVHRSLHSQPLYKWIHKRHHEHHHCALVTNFHFTPLDLLLEAFVPAFGAIMALNSLPFECTRLSQFETSLVFAYLFWYEVGSHAGKEVPTVSSFPPLAWLYRWLWPHLDGDVVRHHETHHNLVKCNYGITKWIDVVMKTRK